MGYKLLFYTIIRRTALAQPKNQSNRTIESVDPVPFGVMSFGQISCSQVSVLLYINVCVSGSNSYLLFLFLCNSLSTLVVFTHLHGPSNSFYLSLSPSLSHVLSTLQRACQQEFRTLLYKMLDFLISVRALFLWLPQILLDSVTLTVLMLNCFSLVTAVSLQHEPINLQINIIVAMKYYF